MEHFTKFNTTGYGPRHLRDLNEAAEQAITDEMDADQIQNEKESLLIGYDEVRRNQIRHYLTERDLRKHSLEQGRGLVKNSDIDLEKLPARFDGKKITREEARLTGIDTDTVIMHVHCLGSIEPDFDLTESEFRAVLAYKMSIKRPQE